MTVTRKIIEIDEEKCTGCGNCVIACAEGAIEIIGGKAKVISDNLCDGLGACIGDCPEDALKIIERDAVEFDEEAVAEHLKKRAETDAAAPQKMACGCPSTHIKDFTIASTGACDTANVPKTFIREDSALSHWPVQIRLVPADAPFLKGADLLIPADCVPIAYPTLHRDFLNGRKVMMGCPKFDDADAYVEKFTEIFRHAGIKSVTCLIMEVPCCSGMKVIVNKAKKASGANVSVEYVVISGKGEIVKREKA